MRSSPPRAAALLKLNCNRGVFPATWR
jgi:hypothetical protein